MDREKVISALDDFNKRRICLPHLIPWDEITNAIDMLKEHEIVHCRECKWYEKCELNDLMLNHENGFCADGERRSDDA